MNGLLLYPSGGCGARGVTRCGALRAHAHAGNVAEGAGTRPGVEGTRAGHARGDRRTHTRAHTRAGARQGGGVRADRQGVDNRPRGDPRQLYPPAWREGCVYTSRAYVEYIYIYIHISGSGCRSNNRRTTTTTTTTTTMTDNNNNSTGGWYWHDNAENCIKFQAKVKSIARSHAPTRTCSKY